LISSYTLVVLETTHIQSYIFNSNRLQENIGASYLVKVATQDWVYDAITLKVEIDKQPSIESGTDVELLYCGGGNAVLLFRDAEKAKQFIQTLSRRVIKEARGLQVTFHSENFIWGQKPLSYAVSDALGQLKLARNTQPLRMGFGGLGVTAMCASSSKPAVEMAAVDDKWLPISAEIYAKRRNTAPANEELQDLIPKEYRDRYTFPRDFDYLGRTKGESSFIAVVHADGNGLGVIIQETKDKFPVTTGEKGNRAYVKYMRDFSENIKHVAKEAMKTVIARLINSIDLIDGHPNIIGVNNQPPIKLNREDEKYTTLPFRPLVSGGDDITFVCDGRIGFDLAITFLQAFEEMSKEIIKSHLTACAGIAIVNTHYPFSRAYELADELCGNAKKKYYGQNVSAFDWHYTTSGLYDDLEGMRAREYQVNGHMLINRPLIISDDDSDNPNRFSLLQRVIRDFQTKEWCDSRNKAKKLADAIRAELLGDFKKNYPELKIPDTPSETLYDALELIDLYIPLKGGKTDVSTD